MISALRASDADSQCSKCYELYGIDFMVTEAGELYILEVNENPEFKITSHDKFAVYRSVFARLLQSLD